MAMRPFAKLGTAPWRVKPPREYTAESVRRWLREEPDSPQAQRVCRQVERLGMYIHDPKLRSKFRGLESYYNRLPSIVSMYLRGKSTEDIADYYRPVFTAYGVAHSLDILCAHIADRLHKDV